MRKFLLAALCAAALALPTLAESPFKFFSGEVSRHEGLGFGAFFNNQYAIGSWRDFANASLGFGIDAEYTLPRLLPLNMDWGATLHLDYGHTFPKKDSSLAQRDDIKFSVGGFLRIPFTAWGQRFAFQPEFCWGIDANSVTGQNGSKANGWYTDQIIIFAPALRWTPPGEKFDKVEFELSPIWTTSPERHGNVVNELGFRLGAIYHTDLFSMGKGFRTKAEREADAQRERDEAEAKKKAAEEKRKAEEEKRLREEEERRRREEEARLKAEEEARRKAEEEAAALEAQKAAEEEARLKAEQEAAEEEARRKAEEEAAALEAQKAAEEEARLKAEQEAAEEEARRKAEEEAAEEEARRKAEEEAAAAAALAAQESAALMNGDENLTPEQEAALSKELKANLAACKENPTILLGVDPNDLKEFTPDGDGDHDTIAFTPSTAYLARPAESWTLKILEPSGSEFMTWNGSGNPPERIVWDGKGINGETVFSYNTYTAALEVVPSQKDKERLGMNTVTAKVDGSVEIKTGVVLEKTGDGEWKIEMTTIPFDPNAATFNRLSAAQKAELKRMVGDIYKKVSAIEGARLTVNGYANNLSGTEKEDREELVPLSQKRAQVMADMMVERGLSADKVKAVGRGGANPIASREDRANWWKNRRVEFVINRHGGQDEKIE